MQAFETQLPHVDGTLVTDLLARLPFADSGPYSAGYAGSLASSATVRRARHTSTGHPTPHVTAHACSGANGAARRRTDGVRYAAHAAVTRRWPDRGDHVEGGRRAEEATRAARAKSGHPGSAERGWWCRWRRRRVLVGQFVGQRVRGRRRSTRSILIQGTMKPFPFNTTPAPHFQPSTTYSQLYSYVLLLYYFWRFKADTQQQRRFPLSLSIFVYYIHHGRTDGLDLFGRL